MHQSLLLVENQAYSCPSWERLPTAADTLYAYTVCIKLEALQPSMLLLLLTGHWRSSLDS
jgi:hypothetical protein